MELILIDITRLLYRQMCRTIPTGIDRVCIEYIRHYRPRARAVLCRGPFCAVMSEADSHQAFVMLTTPGFGSRWFAWKLITKAVLWRWLSVVSMPSYLFNVSHIGLESPFYAWMLRRRGTKLVVMVHDLIPISNPEYCRPKEFDAHHTRMRSAATLSSAIVANSQFTHDAFAKFCNENKLPPPSADVSWLAPGFSAAPRSSKESSRALEGPYFVVLGTIEARKNHWLLLQVWRQIVECMGEKAPKLVIIGQRGWECENVVDLLERCRALKGVVIERGHCSDAELVVYLRHAQALLFPSFVEGFGMPLLEALSLGVPVIASDIAVFREIAGNVPEYAHPLDGRLWEALITDYAQLSSAKRAAQLERIEGYVPTTWAAHFRVVDALLARLQATLA